MYKQFVTFAYFLFHIINDYFSNSFFVHIRDVKDIDTHCIIVRSKERTSQNRYKNRILVISNQRTLFSSLIKKKKKRLAFNCREKFCRFITQGSNTSLSFGGRRTCAPTMTSLFVKITTHILPDSRPGYHLADALRSMSLARTWCVSRATKTTRGLCRLECTTRERREDASWILLTSLSALLQSRNVRTCARKSV